ncbi:MAG: efflux RND transporter periplasmic adaptor subunit [Gammaproteobacteria bacterium]|nr:efflux RND transporter periplasmic adaptor subunit [Gammaproteobacteria bacterium]
MAICTRLWFTLLLATTGFLVNSCEEPAAPNPVLRPVRVQPVLVTGAERERTFAGTSKAGLESNVSFRVAGTIQRLAAKVGDRVKPGTLIAALDPKDYQVQAQEAEASLERARAEERNARANYARVRELYENENASRNELDQARAAAESAAAAVRSAGKQLEFARLQLTYTRLKASADCTVADTYVEEAENVQAGGRVAMLTCGYRPEVEVGVPEAFITQIEKGSRVAVTFDAIPGKTFTAVVTEVGVAVTGQATTYPVIVRLDKPDPQMRPGMAAEVAFRFGTAGGDDRILVPPFAVGEDRQGRFVFVAAPADPPEPGIAIARRRPVTVGELTTEGLEILEGLNDGDLLINAGVSRIEDGLKVKLPGG